MGIEKQLIRLDDGKGILVEVEVDTSQPVLAANLGEVWDVQKSFDTISAFLEKALLPFLHTWQDLSQKVEISEAALKLSVGVTASGNFFLAKGSGSANIEVQVKFVPSKDEKPSA